MTVENIRSTYRQRYGSDPDLVAIAPGRVNLIGEHTDYNDGFVFPAAIDRVTLVALGRTEGLSELYSEQTDEARAFDVTTTEPKQIEDWGKYPAGMGWAMRKAGYMPINVKGVVSSTIPMGSGVGVNLSTRSRRNEASGRTDMLSVAITRQSSVSIAVRVLRFAS